MHIHLESYAKKQLFQKHVEPMSTVGLTYVGQAWAPNGYLDVYEYNTQYNQDRDMKIHPMFNAYKIKCAMIKW